MNLYNIKKKFLLKKILYKIRHDFNTLLEKKLTFFYDYRHTKSCSIIDFTSHLFRAQETIYNEEFFPIPEEVIKNYKKHNFEFLGTGWKNYSINTSINLTLSNQLKRHKKKSLDLFLKLPPTYNLINWQIDIGSNYEWKTSTHWNECLKAIHSGGIEIKNPWELGRLHHFVHFAAYSITDIDKQRRSEFIKEYKNQFYDFYASNPPYMGVQWACPMDVSIRAANLIISFIILHNRFEQLYEDKTFIQDFSHCIKLHGIFIYRHLENKPDLKNNHYLANLSGLIFISIFLQETKDTKQWLNFSIYEFFKEFDHQFLKDGSNFEASTAYHCLSSEMVVLTISLLLGIQSERFKCLQDSPFYKVKDNALIFDEKIKTKINNLNYFFEWITLENNTIIQIGDNDNGHFIKSFPIWDEIFCEIPLNKTSLKLMFSSLIKPENDLSSNATKYFPTYLIQLLTNIKSIPSIPFSLTKNKELTIETDELKFPYTVTKLIKLNEAIILDEIKSAHFPYFGLSIYRTKNFFLSIYYGQVGQDGYGGHSHDDKLSIILISGGFPILQDAGTGCYLKNMSIRNLYRNSNSHPFAVSILSNKNSIAQHSCFSFKVKFNAKILKFNNTEIQINIKTTHNTFLRRLKIEQDYIVVETKSNEPLDLSSISELKYSTCYGIY